VRNLTQSAATLAVLTLLDLLTMVSLVWYGWFLLFEKPFESGIAAALSSLMLTGLAVMLARWIGSQRANKQLTDRRSYRWYFGWTAYGFLFVLSALGTINAAFALFEGSSIVRQDIGSVRSAYDQLQIEANRTLKLPAFERKRADLASELEHLRVEIDNPNGGGYCGVGEAAEQILGRIQRIIPDMPRIRGTGVIRPCNSAVAAKVYRSYEESAYSTLAHDKDFLAFRGPEKEAFLAQLRSQVAHVDEQLAAAEGQLGDVTSFSRPSVQGPLVEATNSYKSDRSVYGDLIRPEQSSLPEQVDISASQELGSIAAVLQIVLKHFFHARTWFYLLIAVLLDLATIYLFTQVYLFIAREYDERAKDPYTAAGSIAKFLWANPPANPGKRTVRHV
jgi:hypothetical protein